MQEVRTDSGGWSVFGGMRYIHEGNGRFLFQSRSNPADTHVLDINEKQCSCWGFQRHGFCIHWKMVSALTKSLKNDRQPRP